MYYEAEISRAISSREITVPFSFFFKNIPHIKKKNLKCLLSFAISKSERQNCLLRRPAEFSSTYFARDALATYGGGRFLLNAQCDLPSSALELSSSSVILSFIRAALLAFVAIYVAMYSFFFGSMFNKLGCYLRR